MDRRSFTRTCLGCIGGAMIPPLLGGCQPIYYTSGILENNGISVMKSEFTYLKKDKPTQREYVIVSNDSLEFPIYLYRISDEKYSAVLMKCTHQGNELQASGDHLTCPAHGSEFDKHGIVAHGPAEDNLRSFPVTSDHNRIFIDLRA